MPVHGPDRLTLFVCGDVMTGRGVDQVLPCPGRPELYEGFVQDAREYVALAEQRNGPVGAPVGFGELWGEALGEWARVAPAVRIVNLETAVTRGGWPAAGKGIHYRMHPDNAGCLEAAGGGCACWPTTTCWTGGRRGWWRRWRSWKGGVSSRRGRGGTAGRRRRRG